MVVFHNDFHPMGSQSIKKSPTKTHPRKCGSSWLCKISQVELLEKESTSRGGTLVFVKFILPPKKSTSTWYGSQKNRHHSKGTCCQWLVAHPKHCKLPPKPRYEDCHEKDPAISETNGSMEQFPPNKKF